MMAINLLDSDVGLVSKSSYNIYLIQDRLLWKLDLRIERIPLRMMAINLLDSDVGLVSKSSYTH